MGIASDNVVKEHQDIDALNRNHPTHLDMRLDGWEVAWKNSMIMVRSNMRFGEIVAYDLFSLMGHDFCEIVATNRLSTGSNGINFWAKNPL